MTEKTIVNATMKRLRSLGLYVVKIHGGPFQQMGLPDLLVVKEGRTIFLEVKQPGEKATLRQEVEHKKLRAAGAIVVVVTSVEEAIQGCSTNAAFAPDHGGREENGGSLCKERRLRSW